MGLWSLDKRKHFAFSVLLVLLACPVSHFLIRRWRERTVTWAPFVATFLTLVIGGLKELTDAMDISIVSKCPCDAEFLDFVADTLGAMVGGGACWMIYRYFGFGQADTLPLHGISVSEANHEKGGG